METVATAPKTARQTLRQDNARIVDPSLRLNDPRFFVQVGWDVLHVDTNGIPNRYLLRGEITPCRSWQAKEHVWNIRAGELIPGTEEKDPTGTQVVYGKYWRAAHFEAERLIENESSATYKTGLVEIQALREAPQVYELVDFNALFYPEGLDKLPETNKELQAHLEARLRSIQVSGEMQPHVKHVVVAALKEVIQAVASTDSIQRSRLQFTHSCMKLTPGEEGFKREYDIVDREMLKRTGVPEIHSTDASVARTLDIMAQKSGNDGLADALKELVAQNQKLMEAILAQKQQAATVPEPPATPPTPTAPKGKNAN